MNGYRDNGNRKRDIRQVKNVDQFMMCCQYNLNYLWFTTRSVLSGITTLLSKFSFIRLS